MPPFERMLALMTKSWMAIFFIGLIVLSFFYFDVPIAFFFHDRDLMTNLPVLNWITKLGSNSIYFTLFFLLALFFRFIRINREWETRAWFLLMCVVIPSVICGFLKVILGRARPPMLFDGHLYGFYGPNMDNSFWSFPSGHTTTIMGVVFGLAILFPRYCYALIVAGLLVALSRVLLTQHYLSDVMAASYLSLLEIGILFCVIRRKSWFTSVCVYAR